MSCRPKCIFEKSDADDMTAVKTADAALFLSGGIGGAGGGGSFLETILEETSEELRSEGESPRPPCWLDDSDADSVIHVPHVSGKDDYDSGSERDYLCPAKRRRPNQARRDCSSPTDTASLSLSLSRSSSLAQFESLEQTCQLLEGSAPPSPLSLLSVDSLEKFKAIPEISPDSLENSSDSEPHSTSSQESAYMAEGPFFKVPPLESHFNDRSLTEERFDDATFVVSAAARAPEYWNGDDDRNDGSSSGEFSDARSSDSERTVHEKRAASKEEVPHKYNFKSCRSLDALTSFESLDTSKIDGAASKRGVPKQTNRQYSAENLSEDSGYSDHFCNFLRIKSKSIPNVSSRRTGGRLGPSGGSAPERRSDDCIVQLFESKRKSEIVEQFGARGKFEPKAASPPREMALKKRSGEEGKRRTPGTEIDRGARPRPARSLPDVSGAGVASLGRAGSAAASESARLSDAAPGEREELYSVSSVPKDLNLCDADEREDRPSIDDNWSFGSERKASVSAAPDSYDLCDFPRARKSRRAHDASFKQSFRACDGFTASVADLTVLDYRSEPDGAPRKLPVRRRAGMSGARPQTRERSAESDSTTESEKAFLFEMEKTMRELNEQSRKILATTFDDADFDRNLSVLTNKRLNAQLSPFDEVIAELERKQARSRPDAEAPPRTAPEYEFDYYGDEADPPYYRRAREPAAPDADDSSPDVSEAFGGGDAFYHSTPAKGTDRVQSTPNLNAFNQSSDELYAKATPAEELRSSMQHVPLKSEFKPVGILGSKSQGLSGSGGSRGVHFCPVVAEVSWRERSYSEDSTGVVSSASSACSGGSEETPLVEDETLKEAEVEVEETPESATETAAEEVEAVSDDVVIRSGGGAEAPGPSVESTARARAPAHPAMERPALPPKPARSRLGGFLSRFANFRFSARKSNAKKKSDAGAQGRKDERKDEERPVKTGAPGEEGARERTPDYVYIPLKGRPPLPPGAAGGAQGPGGARTPRAPAGLLETDLDTATTRTLPPRARSLLALPPPAPQPRNHKSMEYLLDKDNLRTVEPPENDLQKNSNDRVLSEHQLRVQRSLQKLNLPDWYKNSPVPREGFLLKKRASDAGAGTRGWETPGLGSKTTSLGSLGGGAPPTRSPLALTPPSQQLGFARWSTSRLNSAQTSPCSSARSSIRGGNVSPLSSPARPPRAPRPTRAPYLGWRSQERLASPRTPHERLAVSLLPQSPPVPSQVSDEIQSSIKEVTSAIVHYVSGLEPGRDAPAADDDGVSASPRGSPRLCWLESSFVGTKPLESPQTPVVVGQLAPPRQRPQPRPLQLDLPSSRPAANGSATLSATTYQHGEYVTTLT